MLKNNILKLLVIGLMLAMSLTVLAGCGKKEENNNQNENTSNTTSDNNQNANNTENTSNTTSDNNPNANNTEDSSNTTSDNNQTTKKELSRGKWKDKVYTSEFADLKFTLPDGWTRSTDEEIAQTMQLGEDVLKNENLYVSEISKLNVVYDMMAKNSSTGGNVTVMMEKNAGTAKDYANALKTQLGQLTQVKYTIGDVKETKIGNNTYTVLTTEASASGATVFQNYYLRDEGDYVVAVLVTETSKDNLDKVVKCFE